MLCYKYMPWDYWFDSILMGRLKLSVPSEFNDPFDCGGDVVGSYRQSVIDDWVDKNFEPSEELPTREIFKSAFLLTYQEHMRLSLRARKYFDQLCRILCLVNAEQKMPDGDDLLLWSHYTGNAINFVYSKCTRDWSRLERCWSGAGDGNPTAVVFDNKFNVVLSALGAILECKGSRADFKDRRDDLWLNCVCHARSWEELEARIAAEKEQERKAKEARAEWREERKVRAEEERNAVLRGIENAIRDLPR